MYRHFAHELGEARTTEQERRAAATAEAGGHGQKRTPTSAFDPAAGKDVYEPEKIIGQRLSKGVTTFNVKWVGYTDKDSTWEPIEHLAGCEDMIAEFMEREKTRIAQLEAVAQAKHAEKAAAAAQALADASASAAAARVEAAKEAAGNDLRRSPRKRGSRPWWWTIPLLVAASMTRVPSDRRQFGLPLTRRARPVGRPAASQVKSSQVKCCKLWKDNLVENGVCGAFISIAGGPTAMWNHVMYKHPSATPRDRVRELVIVIWWLMGCVVGFWQLPDSGNSA